MTFMQPGGPLPPSVYWRRRLIVLAILVIVIAVIVTWVSALFGGGSQTATPTDGSTAGAVPACNSKDVTLTANTDQESYAEGELPQLSMTITNTGDAACTFEVGTDKQKYVIMSGTDMIWDSTVCQNGSEPYTTTLDPGVAVDVPAIEWGRARSDNCDSGTAAIGGGASYQLNVYVGDVQSSEPKQFMLF
ncbi:MAG: hypothetical protein RLZZ319_861 [Actinomycetota bacterium]|jgi:hypothetical protein